MLRSSITSLLVWLLLCSEPAAFAAATAQRQKTESRPPNIVLIISDDHGWQDYGFMGHPHIKTPHLDRLAAQSLVFPRGYVPTSLCSPSLASLITGRYPHEHLITGNDPPAPPGGKQGDWRNHPQYLVAWEELRSNIKRFPLLPALLRQRGYLSFQTGKWWMGSFANGGFTHGMTHGDKARGGRHGDEGLTIGRKTMQPIYDFIGQAAGEQRPFLLWYAPMLPHSPHNAPQRLIDKYKDQAPDRETARYWASVEWFDETCGELLAYLDRERMADNTIVVYVTDNGWIQGPQADAQSLRSKRTPYDAGIRTPIMLRWPGKVKPRRSDRLASSLDILPTLLDAAGISAPPGLPGLNLLDDRAVNARKTLFGAIFTHDAVDLRKPSANLMTRWVIDGEWKLLVPVPGQANEEQPQQIELYRITLDPEERTNRAAKEPGRVEALRRKLGAWWAPQSK
jgi:uncharacterized sulfatase